MSDTNGAAILNCGGRPEKISAGVRPHRIAATEANTMTFDDVCRVAKLTKAERTDMAWFLTMLRARKLVEALTA